MALSVRPIQNNAMIEGRYLECPGTDHGQNCVLASRSALQTKMKQTILSGCLVRASDVASVFASSSGSCISAFSRGRIEQLFSFRVKPGSSSWLLVHAIAGGFSLAVISLPSHQKALGASSRRQWCTACLTDSDPQRDTCLGSRLSFSLFPSYDVNLCLPISVSLLQY